MIISKMFGLKKKTVFRLNTNQGRRYVLQCHDWTRSCWCKTRSLSIIAL